MAITREEAIRLRKIIEKAVPHLDDETALQGVTLFPMWRPDTAYEVDMRVKYMNVLYRVITAHTSQADWTPDVSASLFAKVLIPNENEIPAWEQPDSTNPYMKGDKVSHNGCTWESLIDNNTWEPGVVGTESLWTQVA